MQSDTVNKIRIRTQKITKRINLDFWGTDSNVDHSFYSGSYGRRTEIFISDIDLMVVLPYAKYAQYNRYSGNGQSRLLQEVKQSIDKTYNSKKSGDGQVVKVEFTDRISFDIVPCFINNDGQSYTFPDTHSNGSWKKANPKAEIKEINRMNNECNKNLKELCRMARIWKKVNNVKMSGFLIDTLAYNFLKDWGYKKHGCTYYDWMVRDFFNYLKNRQITTKFYYAPGSNQQATKGDNFEYKAKQAYNLSTKAIEKERAGHYGIAHDDWRSIFGPRIPKRA